MKTRIIENWRSTVTGIFLFIMSSTLLFLKVITFTEYVAFLPTILGLLYVRDSVFKLNPSKRPEDPVMNDRKTVSSKLLSKGG